MDNETKELNADTIKALNRSAITMLTLLMRNGDLCNEDDYINLIIKPARDKYLGYGQEREIHILSRICDKLQSMINNEILNRKN